MDTTELKRVQRFLMGVYAVMLAATLAVVLLGETGVIPNGVIAHLQIEEYYTAIVMELLTICIIPVALRLFKFDFVARRLVSPSAMRPWALCRMMMIGLPMIANSVLYYLYYNVAFGYMGIILFLCCFFITPTERKCEEEITPPSSNIGSEQTTEP